MAPVSLPHDARAGPTKPDVRAVLPSKLDLGPTDHFAEVGSCTGAVTIEAARRAGRVTALERKPNRLEVTERNLAANDRTAEVALREAEAPAGLPADADALFLGGSRNYEVAGAATDAFRERGLLGEVIQFQVSHVASDVRNGEVELP